MMRVISVSEYGFLHMKIEKIVILQTEPGPSPDGKGWCDVVTGEEVVFYRAAGPSGAKKPRPRSKARRVGRRDRRR